MPSPPPHPPVRGGGVGTSAGVTRARYRIRGVVQGVGYRPFVHRLATGLGLVGHVGNDSDGVFCEVQGPGQAVQVFTDRLRTDAPPLARIESVTTTSLEPIVEHDFAIVASRGQPGGLTLVSPDLSPCDACLAELTDPGDRRHGYPFLNCTNCGPRFTITHDVPYDRPRTTMAGFDMCDRCRREYDDPADRRFHAQPTACWDCGPQLWLEAPVGSPLPADDPLDQAVALVRRGGIVGIKGVGGYHLACRADDDDAVALLRERKHRPAKPLAVMVADVGTARQVAHVDAAEAALLTGAERPIVLLQVRPDAGLSPLVAPGLISDRGGLVGVMLPSSPLHAMLLDPGEVWVMTSGNRSSEPICITDSQARDRLDDIADALLGHDRPITVPCDDSVIRVVGDGQGGWSPLPIRRSRGYTPYPVAVDLPDGPVVLAVGGELKATFCLRRGDHAFLSQHIGDMANLETLQAFDHAVAHMTSLFWTTPEVLACDAHPGYLSADWARRHADGRTVIEVQHHHAHIASLLAEHRMADPIIGFSFDGTGYGTDGTIWGGEVLVADLGGFERVGHLRPALLAGGDTAVRRPYRQALARLSDAGLTWTAELPPVRATPLTERRVLKAQLRQQLGTVTTTSMGRLFDAVASLCDVRQTISYEGQAAIELEAGIDPDEPGRYTIDIDEDGIWDTRALVAAVSDDVLAGTPAGRISARFHRAVVDGVVAAAGRVRSSHGLTRVGLSGGVFQNVVLTTAITAELRSEGFEVLTHRVVPPNDGGLALGQAAVAAFRSSGAA